MSKTAILPKAAPVLFFLTRGVQALPKKEWRIARENRLARYSCQRWYQFVFTRITLYLRSQANLDWW